MISIPEAHCYVRYDQTRIDITRVSSDATEAIALFWHEESIRPDQIGDYKARVHRQFMTQWAHANPAAARHKSVEELWHIRERCIAALAS